MFSFLIFLQRLATENHSCLLHTLPTYPSVYLSVYLSICVYISIRLSVCLSICLHNYLYLSILSMCLYPLLSIYLSIYIYLCLSIYPSYVYVYIHCCLSIYLFICLSVCPSIYPSMSSMCIYLLLSIYDLSICVSSHTLDMYHISLHHHHLTNRQTKWMKLYLLALIIHHPVFCVVHNISLCPPIIASYDKLSHFRSLLKWLWSGHLAFNLAFEFHVGVKPQNLWGCLGEKAGIKQ